MIRFGLTSKPPYFPNLNPETKYSDLNLQTEKELTYILGSKCKDGVVLIGDRKITSEDGSYIGYRKKIFQEGDSVVWGAAGNPYYFNSFRNRVRIELEKNNEILGPQFITILEDVYGSLLKTYDYYFPRNFAALVGVRTEKKESGKYDTGLYQISGMGGHQLVKKYQAIGTGNPYGKLFLKKTWDKRLNMKQVAEIGYFIINMTQKLHLDETVGVGKKHPQIWFIPDIPQPKGGDYGTDLKIRPATTPELEDINQKVSKKLDILRSDLKGLFNDKH